MRMAFCDRPGRGLVSIIALAGTSVPAIALAQSLPAVPPATAAQADEGAVGDDVNAAEGGPIVVTGTRIASGFDAPTPVSVMGAERLAERGASNIGDALNELPAFRSTQTPASTGLSAAADDEQHHVRSDADRDEQHPEVRRDERNAGLAPVPSPQDRDRR